MTKKKTRKQQLEWLLDQDNMITSRLKLAVMERNNISARIQDNEPEIEKADRHIADLRVMKMTVAKTIIALFTLSEINEIENERLVRDDE